MAESTLLLLVAVGHIEGLAATDECLILYEFSLGGAVGKAQHREESLE